MPDKPKARRRGLVTRWLRRLVRVLLVALAVLGAIQTAQGAPQTLRWMAAVGFGRPKDLALVLTALIAIVALALAAGPERVKGLFRRGTPTAHALPGAPQPTVVPAVLDRIEFDFGAHLERKDDFLSLHGITFERAFTLWVHVTNHASRSMFGARIPTTSGLPKGWEHLGVYDVRHPLWEGHPSEETREIGHEARESIVLADIARSPRAFWFNTTQNGVAEVGNQLHLSEGETRVIEFVLRVWDTRAENRPLEKTGRLTIPPSVDETTFAWVVQAAGSSPTAQPGIHVIASLLLEVA
jgi:hypothetical protein